MCNERYNGVTRREEPTDRPTERERPSERARVKSSSFLADEATRRGANDDTSLGVGKGKKGRERPPAELSDGKPS